MGIAVIEAQANGLPCIYSKNVPEEVHINDNCCSLDIEDKPEIWAEKIIQIGQTDKNRVGYNDIVYQSDFSVMKVVENLEKIYLRE